MNTYRYYSDLHGLTPGFQKDSDSEEICIVAGDVANFGNKGKVITEILSALCMRFKEVIFVPGNHEYYGTKLNVMESKVKEAMAHFGNFILLQNADYIERDGVRIIGATMWSDTSEIQYEASTYMNDYQCIRYGTEEEPWKHKLTPVETTRIHKEHVRLINEAIKSHNGASIVITHHAPSYQSVSPEFEGSSVNPAYATDIELDEWPYVWIHGHIHSRSDYYIYNCNVLCNPGGYAGESTGFGQTDNSFKL